jgi:hypothetical protein
VVATRVWLARQVPTPARRQARRIALGAIVLSVVGNAVDHVLAAYRIVPPWWTVVAVAAVAPAVLGAVAHLVALVVAPDEDHEVTGVGEPGEVPLVSPALQLVQVAEELVRTAEENGDPMGRETLAGHLGITPNQARQVLAVLRDWAGADAGAERGQRCVTAAWSAAPGLFGRGPLALHERCRGPLVPVGADEVGHRLAVPGDLDRLVLPLRHVHQVGERLAGLLDRHRLRLAHAATLAQVLSVAQVCKCCKVLLKQAAPGGVGAPTEGLGPVT